MFGAFLLDLAFAALFTIDFLFAGAVYRFSSERSSGLILQKLAPKFLIMVGEIVGGETEHPKQFLSLQADVLKPLFTFFSLKLLLRSSSR